MNTCEEVEKLVTYIKDQFGVGNCAECACSNNNKGIVALCDEVAKIGEIFLSTENESIIAATSEALLEILQDRWLQKTLRCTALSFLTIGEINLEPETRDEISNFKESPLSNKIVAGAYALMTTDRFRAIIRKTQLSDKATLSTSSYAMLDAIGHWQSFLLEINSIAFIFFPHIWMHSTIIMIHKSRQGEVT